MISSVVHREFLEEYGSLNIVWTSCDSVMFREFIKNSCAPCHLLDLHETYYGIYDISLIICNNRITHLDKSIELAKFLSCPILIVDHEIKSSNIKDDIQTKFIIDQVYSIALSQEISFSWGKIHNNILDYNITNINNKQVWKDLIFKLCKSNITVSSK